MIQKWWQKAVIYQIYPRSFCDSNGDGIGDTITNGKSIDVFRYTLQDAKDWIKQYGDYVYIKIIDAEG